jgi:hypothetical protein
VNQLIQQLLDLIRRLRPAPGAADSRLSDLLAAFAASAIQKDPSQAEVDGVDLDPQIAEAIRQGRKLASALVAAHQTIRIEEDDFLANAPAHQSSDLPFQVYGPFVNSDGRLRRFLVFQSSPFIAVHSRPPSLFPLVGELMLLIPADSTPSGAGNRKWVLTAGTIWVRSRFLLATTSGFAGVRISGGTLEFDRDVARNGNVAVALSGSKWKLVVKLEQPPSPDVAGSDAEALDLTLPAELEVRSDGAPAIRGGATVAGFGSTVNVSPIAGPVFLENQQICFPTRAAEAEWTIRDDLSLTAKFDGRTRIDSSFFAIAISSAAPGALGQAAHGGSLVLHLRPGLSCTLMSQTAGAFRLLNATLQVNARQIELSASGAESSARYDLELWSSCITSLRFARQPITRFVFRSERGEMDVALVGGGSVLNKWDLPKQANGHPFGFEGTIDAFALVSTTSGTLFICNGTSAPQPVTTGLALENVYFLVRQPRRCLLVAAFDDAPKIPSGVATLYFDVAFALPTLPDPYAANISLPERGQPLENALRIALDWHDSNKPSLSANLERQVMYPRRPADRPRDPDELIVAERFSGYLDALPESLYLLDLSSRQHLFGVALEPPSDNPPALTDNLLSVQLQHVRLLMQPQVQWEPVRIEPNPKVPTLVRETVHSNSNGGPTLVGANSVKLVPTLPGRLSTEIIDAVRGGRRGAALFSLPFGLRAVATFGGPRDERVERRFLARGTASEIHQPEFDDVSSAPQIRLTARSSGLQPSPSRYMDGMMRQLQNLQPNASGLTSVTPNELRDALNGQFSSILPLHRADLSGYGLSTFSEWRLDVEGAGFSKVQFHVLNGRTAFEVIQFRSALFECGARVVRTVILERHNAGKVVRSDSGWVAIEAGLFVRPVPFEKGLIKSFQNIRNIRIAGAAFDLDATCAVEPVIFDADAEIEGLIGGGAGGLVPIYDRPGYIQVKPPPPAPLPPDAPKLLSDGQLKLLFNKVGPIRSSVDCAIRVGSTLDAHLTSIDSDVALDDGNGIGFAVAAVGGLKLPRAAQWNAVKIDPSTIEVSPVDQRRGVPIVHRQGQNYRFREPSDVRRTNPRVEYGLMMSTGTSRALFAKPEIDPTRPGKLNTNPPVLADPYSLVQATGAFPRPAFALRLKEAARFDISAANDWRITNPNFSFDTPLADLIKGAEWAMNRRYEQISPIRLNIDSLAAAPWGIDVPPSNIDVELPAPLGKIFTIRSFYKAQSGDIPKLDKPDLIFSGALEQVKETLNKLSALTGLPFNFDVTVTAGGSVSPSFIVRMSLVFRIGEGPNERIDIGVGKFYGQFLIRGELEAATKGVERALLFLEFQGDVQQGIIPPLIYAGGLFRFGIEVRDMGRPIVQLTLGCVASIGGDLIKGLIEVEITVEYGYTLIPETLEPGVLLGLEARAKLLGGLVGFSFNVEAMARLKRVNTEAITIWAQIRVAASVQVAIFVEEEVDFQTQFQQEIPLAAASLIPGVGLLPAATQL